MACLAIGVAAREKADEGRGAVANVGAGFEAERDDEAAGRGCVLVGEGAETTRLFTVVSSIRAVFF